MNYSFFALISRMRNIDRWALMRNSSRENVQEHSHMAAVIAHALAVTRRELFGGDIDPGLIASAALYHDAPEILTGDMPTPIKYHNQEFMAAYKRLELQAGEKLLTALPPELRPAYRPLLTSGIGEQGELIIKAADRLAAYIKCLEEVKAGNAEFRLAAEQTKKKLLSMQLPELDYFLEHFIPAFELTLDELDFNIKEN